MVARSRLLGALAAVATALGCTDMTGSAAGRLAVRFVSPSSSPTASATSGPALSAPLATLVVAGSNGTLELDEIWLVADEFRLQRSTAACEPGGPNEDCERFEAPPSFTDVSLDGTPPGAVAALVAAGTYEELKFETREPRSDGVLLAEIREQFSDWPEDASMLVLGTFMPDGGEPVSFRVYFSGEVRVELAFEGEPLVISAGEEDVVTVHVNPEIWFVEADGSVTDLTQYDFDATGEVVAFEAKFKDGFTKIEID